MPLPPPSQSNPIAAWLVSRRALWLFGAIAIAIMGLLVFRLTALSAAKNALADKANTPTVTVTSVALSSVPTTVSIIGTISARYDIPIGVEGDGGLVNAIYVEAGDRVKKGQVLARLSTSVLVPQVASLSAALEQSRAEADLAAAEYHRALAVGAAGALSTEETERRHSTAVTAAAKVKVAAAQLAEAQARVDRADVRAPADGMILTRNVELGQTATPGGPALFRLAQGNEIELRGEVAEQDLPQLKLGQGARVSLTGVSEVFEGRVRLLGAVIDPQTRLGMVRISLHPNPNLRPGAFARADVIISNAERAVLPQTAVLSDDKGSYVLVVDAQNKIERRHVRLSGVVPNGVTIAEGLGVQDQVVATAGGFLQEGEVVKPARAAAGGA
ncbi:MAG TPA: efflux RND transporter periplasmic adaptor subunit [Steroidobacteraceae bacterium]|nr:efflux RND transporter periplasmic adaptor subunit [Steroidobacteraceae bacterium]